MPTAPSSLARTIATILLLVAILTCPPPAVDAAPLRCATPLNAHPDSLHFETGIAFFPHRSGVSGVHRHWRDIEFMWDRLYGAPDQDHRTTLDKLAASIVDLPGNNPFGIPAPNFQLIYEYFRQGGAAYTLDPTDTTTVDIGNFDRLRGDSATRAYKPSDRSHLDVYIPNPGRGLNYGGITPSTFISYNEDSTTNETNDPKPGNSIEVVGPWPGQDVDLTGTGWTSPSGNFARGLNHEFQHSLPIQTLVGGTLFSELFSAGAEAIGGHAALTPTDDFPYVFSLLSFNGGGGACETYNTNGSNYQGRTAFMSYLAYNFAGDTTRSLASIEDDVLYKWAHRPGTQRTFAVLRGLLNNAKCADCAGRHYFHPGGIALDDTSRLALLLHNWRVANYVNNPGLEEGQYGYPSRFGFSPTQTLGAFQALNVCWNGSAYVPKDADDLTSVPPEVSLSSRFVTRDTTIAGSRSFRGSTYPLVLQPLGSEYWLVRADASLSGPGRDLVIRVAPEGLGSRLEAGTNCSSVGTSDSRMVASAMCYRQDFPAGEPAELWRHPEWVYRALSPKWVNTDNFASDLEFVVPSFGDSVKAVLVVLTLADGPTQAFSTGQPEITQPLLSYRLNLSVRGPAAPAAGPITFAGSPSIREEHPVWSPLGDQIAYMENTTPAPQIFVRHPDGSSRQALYPSVLPQRNPEWSPRPEWVAFSQYRVPTVPDAWDLCAYNRTTQELRILTPTSQLYSEITSSFSPDGQQLAYCAVAPQSMNTQPGSTLHRVNLSGSGDVVLVWRPDSIALSSPRWTPDGGWIYFTVHDTLYAVGATGANTGVVVERSQLASDVAWLDMRAGDDRVLLCQRGEEVHEGTCFSYPNWYDVSQHYPYQHIAFLDTVRRVSDVRFFRPGLLLFEPRWSLDGTQIAYSLATAEQGAGGDRNIEVARVSWNRAPVYSSPPRDTTIESGATCSFDLDAIDPDGEPVTFAAAYLPTGSSFNPQTGIFSWSPTGGAQETYVVFRAFDGSGGVAQRVVRISVHAATNPATVANVTGEFVASEQVGLTWDVPSDDLPYGRVVEYDIRYRTGPTPITESNWSNSTQATGEPTPVQPDTTLQSFAVTGLQSCTWYYFAMKCKDEAGHWSAISNSPHIKTTCSGGGGVFAQRIGPTQEAGSDGAPALPGGAGGTSNRSRAGVETDAVIRSGSGVLLVETERTAAGERWLLRLGNSEEEAALFGGDSSQVCVQRSDSSDADLSASRLGRAIAGPIGVVSPVGSRRRLALRGAYSIAYAAAKSSGAEGLENLALVAAQHSRLGDLLPADGSDVGEVALAPGDSVRLDYAATVDTALAPGDWALVLVPTGTTATIAIRTPKSPEAAPLSFALYQSRPNPFTSEATIRFDLPRPEHVELTVLDLQGREVATLVSSTLPAGRHSAIWNGRGKSGSALPAGIYLYRLTAGTFVAQRKMTLLP